MKHDKHEDLKWKQIGRGLARTGRNREAVPDRTRRLFGRDALGVGGASRGDYFLSAPFRASISGKSRSGILSMSFFAARYSAAAFSKSFRTGFLPWS